MRDELTTNQVQVNVWDHPETKHFSIQTKASYIGFYAVERPGEFPFINTINDYESDLRRIGKEPNEAFIFDGLDVNAIDAVIAAMPNQVVSNEILDLASLLGQQQINLSIEDRNLLGEISSGIQQWQGFLARRRDTESNFSSRFQTTQVELVQHVNLENLILFVLYQGGIGQFIPGSLPSNLAFARNFVGVLHPALPLHRNHFRGIASTFLLLDLILTANYFLKIDNVNEYSLAFALPFCCIVCCCLSARNFSKPKRQDLGDTIELTRFEETKQRLRVAQQRLLPQLVMDDASDLAPNEVCVRIWRGKNGDVGHVSLQTRAIYASFWPESTSKGAVFSVRGKFQTYADDMVAEQRPADAVFKFDKLNVEAIHKVYRQFQSQDQNWTLLGSSLLKESEKNCCGLTLGLLRTGGLELEAYGDSWMLDCTACTLVCIFTAVVAGVLYFPVQERILQNGPEQISPQEKGMGAVINVALALCVIIQFCYTVMFCRRNFKGQGLIYTPNGFEKLLGSTVAKDAAQALSSNQVSLLVNDPGNSDYDYNEDDYDDDPHRPLLNADT